MCGGCVLCCSVVLSVMDGCVHSFTVRSAVGLLLAAVCRAFVSSSAPLPSPPSTSSRSLAVVSSVIAIRFPPAPLSDCVLHFGLTSFHCHRLLLWQSCHALRPLLVPRGDGTKKFSDEENNESNSGRPDCHTAAPGSTRRPMRARKPSYSLLTPRWMVTDEGEEEADEEEEAEGGEVEDDKAHHCGVGCRRHKQLGMGKSSKQPLSSSLLRDNNSGCGCHTSIRCIDLRAVLADARWDAGHCHGFLLHLYFPRTLHCPPFLPAGLTPHTLIQLSTPVLHSPSLLLSEHTWSAPALHLPSDLCSCGDGAYVLYECVLGLSQSLGCQPLLSRCEAVLCAVCGDSGLDSARNGLYLATNYRMDGLRAACMQLLSRWRHTADSRQQRYSCRCRCSCCCAGHAAVEQHIDHSTTSAPQPSHSQSTATDSVMENMAYINATPCSENERRWE